ncbi:MAG: peptidoglycan recognition family protein [Dehalococcoidia bacterium]|nr:peptidoglycan recognition family protein [Dehalococcoidia bacterium]
MKIGNMEGIIDLRGKLPGREDYARRELGDIRYLVVHHSGVARDSTAVPIARYHAEVLGWPGIGYHFLVHQDGTIEYVGDILEVRYNVARRNQEVVGVCLPGDFTYAIGGPEEAQLKAAHDLLANLQFALGWFVPILGHREIALPAFATACPGDTFLRGPRWKDWIAESPPQEGGSPPEAGQ